MNIDETQMERGRIIYYHYKSKFNLKGKYFMNVTLKYCLVSSVEIFKIIKI